MTLPAPPPDLKGASIVFDLDGTLVDTAGDLTAALNHVLRSAGRAPVEPRTVRMLVGHGALTLIERGFAGSGPPVAADSLRESLSLFLSYYAEHIAVKSKPFPGVEEALARYSKAGALLGVCTNKPEPLALKLLEALNLGLYFPVVMGPDTIGIRKPDPRVFHETVLRLKGDPRRSVLIGDSPTDVATARAAGVPVIAVTFGYTPVPPEELDADELIGHFDELDAALARTLAQEP